MKQLIPFIKLFKRQLWWIVLGLALSWLTVLSSIGLLSLSGWFLSAAAFASLSYATAANFNFFLPAAGVRFFSMARIGGRYGERVATHEATFKILTELRVWFYQAIEPLTQMDLFHYKSGDLLNRIVTDIDALDSLYIRIILPCGVFMLTAGFVLFFFSFFSLKIALVCVGILILAAISVPVFSMLLARRTAQELTQCLADFKSESVEYVQGIAVLKLFGYQQHKKQLVADHNKQLIAKQNRMSHFTGVGAMLMTLFLGVSVLAAVWIACGLVSQKQLNGANIALLALGVIGAYESVLILPVAFQYLGKMVRSADRLLTVARTKQSLAFGDSPALKEPFDIRFDHVAFNYSSTQVLKQVDFTVARKMHLAIVGPTGAGKTTLVHMLSRFIQPLNGAIYFSDQRIETFSEQALRQMLTVVPQNDHIFNMSIRENLLMANNDATQHQIEQVLQVVSLADYVNHLSDGLDSEVGENGQNLSGGQRKRLMIARALLKEAPIYIFDEPTEGLDKQTEVNLIDSLKAFLKHKTFIIITHSVNAADKMDSCLTIDNGSIINE